MPVAEAEAAVLVEKMVPTELVHTQVNIGLVHPVDQPQVVDLPNTYIDRIREGVDVERVDVELGNIAHVALPRNIMKCAVDMVVPVVPVPVVEDPIMLDLLWVQMEVLEKHHSVMFIILLMVLSTVLLAESDPMVDLVKRVEILETGDLVDKEQLEPQEEHQDSIFSQQPLIRPHFLDLLDPTISREDKLMWSLLN